MTIAKYIILQSVTDEKEINYDIIKKTVTKNIFPNLFKLIQVAMSLPINSATCERSFSAIRKIKTWFTY